VRVFLITDALEVLRSESLEKKSWFGKNFSSHHKRNVAALRSVAATARRRRTNSGKPFGRCKKRFGIGALKTPSRWQSAMETSRFLQERFPGANVVETAPSIPHRSAVLRQNRLLAEVICKGTMRRAGVVSTICVCAQPIVFTCVTKTRSARKTPDVTAPPAGEPRGHGSVDVRFDDLSPCWRGNDVRRRDSLGCRALGRGCRRDCAPRDDHREASQ